MKKLITMFKNLPPEMRMMIAMAGLGSPIGIIYALKRWCFPNTATFVVILYVVGAIAVVCLLGWLVSKIFGRGKSKRADRMAAELAADADAGRSSMDVAAAIKENNQKFFGAIADMNKSVGLSVYDLPWYVVIGDSGCGKTKLINEGGLQFSLGKPEGYQLGTLNYNWWFTEDAVFVDMAGRLINPRDDADRKEWEAFLATIAKGRKGFPINGVVVCVAADHLLQDAPDRIEQDANTMLERLRDLQSRLGVTFATYLVITKCDKMVGFMQFFDRAERDIRVLNQMVGWSKPGEFHELYDPEAFPEHFDDIYRRLHELRLRRMNDDADEIDLGLAYGFPEEFRELREPLHTYVRTLFPRIKNPRAIKNLLFRGLYFTSATREGGLVLKHLTDRLGPEAAEQFQPLDIYPSKRPYFIRDFFFRKMFPEHGLVFRNEEQAVRNRKLAKVLKYGSVSLAVLLIGTAVLSIIKFADVIDRPRKIATQLHAQASLPQPEVALERARELKASAGELGASGWANVLSLWYGTDAPVQGLEEIQAALFERVLLRQAIKDISQALRTVRPGPPTDEAALEEGQAFLDALEQYVTWYACSADEASSWRGTVTQEGFKTMCKIVKNPDSPINHEGFLTQSGYYFDTVGRSDEWKSPARLLSRNGEQPEKTIRFGLEGGAYEYFSRLATLDSANPNPIIAEWMRIGEACVAVAKSYEKMLAFADQEFHTSEDMQAFKDSFAADYATFTTNLAQTDWQSKRSFSPIREAILATRKEQWVAYVEKLTSSLQACGATPDAEVADVIIGLQRGHGTQGLDELLWSELRRVQLTTTPYAANEDLFGDQFMDTVQELYEPFGYMIQPNPEADANEAKLQRTADAARVDGILKEISAALAAAGFLPADPPGKPSDWLDPLDAALNPDTPPGTTVPDAEFDGIGRAWSPDPLANLYKTHKSLIHQGRVRAILQTVRLGLSNLGAHGLAMLEPDADTPEPSAYYIAQADLAQQPAAATPESKGTVESGKKRRVRRPPSRRGRSEAPTESPVPRTILKRGRSMVPHWASRSFLNHRVDEAFLLRFYLTDIQSDEFLQSENDPDLLNRLCARLLEDAAQSYFDSYASAWSDAYLNLPLDGIDELVTQRDDWKSLIAGLRHHVTGAGKGYQVVGNELLPALSEILASIPFWGYTKLGPEWVPPYTDPRPNYRTVAEWMRAAIRSRWSPEHGVFADQARIPSIPGMRQDEPWTAIEQAFAQRWEALGASLMQIKPFPESFAGSGQKKLRREIAWPRFKELRSELRLDDERITGALQEFEEHAQDLLSIRITQILVRIQRDKLGTGSRIGWPFLDDFMNKTSTLHETVDFQKFLEFLQEVGRAQQYFSPLEQDLPETRTATARSVFYDQCEAWRTFLGLKQDSKGIASPESLVISEVKSFDPLDPDACGSGPNSMRRRIELTGSRYYRAAQLDVGLSIAPAGTGQYTNEALRIPTAVGEQALGGWQAEWKWDGAGSMAFEVVEPYKGYPNVPPKELGNQSPLSFCSYLLSGTPRNNDRRVWCTVHGLDIAQAWKRAGREPLKSDRNNDGEVILGLGFEFTLKRAMPMPIAALTIAE